MRFEYTGSHFRIVVELFEVRLDLVRQQWRGQPKIHETSRRRLLAQVIRRIKQK